MKTSLQKCKDFLEEMNIKYEIEESTLFSETCPQWYLKIDSDYISNCGDLTIRFNKEGKFIALDCYGY